MSQRVLSERTQKWTSVLLSGSVPVIESQINLFKIKKQIWDQTRTLNRLVCHSLDSGSGFNCSYLNQGVKKKETNQKQNKKQQQQNKRGST